MPILIGELMAADGIKEITVEIRRDTKGLKKALSGIKFQSKRHAEKLKRFRKTAVARSY